MEERNMQLEARLREREAVEELNRRRNQLLKKKLIDSEEQIEEVEKVMLEKGITNHEAAAEYWAWMKQSAPLTPNVGYNPNPSTSLTRRSIGRTLLRVRVMKRQRHLWNFGRTRSPLVFDGS